MDISSSLNCIASEDFNHHLDDEEYCDLTIDDINIDLQPSQGSTTISEDNLIEDIQKVQPFSKEQVRWFYVSGTKKNKPNPMIGCDSIRVEEAYQVYLQNPSNFDEKICIRGGLYEVNFADKCCYPIYWSNINDIGDCLIRGTWFYDNWLPLATENATVIENEHQARWKGYDINLIKELMNNKVMHSVQLKDFHVEWTSVTDVILYKDATAHRAIRNIGQRIGVSKATSSGYRLHRGYKHIADPCEDFAPVSNLIFVIHGIGARGDRRKVARNTNEFRGLCRKFEDEKDELNRSIYIPVEWRSRLKLNEDLIASITPNKGLSIRRLLHNTALDIMYYTSYKYRNEVVNGLRAELNRVFNIFISRNPTFSGKISVFAHSLGNIIIHDILTKWKPDDCDLNPVKSSNLESSSDPSLSFEIDNLFSLGSPLGIFFCLRGHHPDGDYQKILPPHCRRIFNIYHPADPVAYRLEPLIYEHYTNVKPVQIESVYEINKNKLTTEVEEAASVSSKINPAPDVDNEVYETPNKSSYLRSVTGGAFRLGSRLFNRSSTQEKTESNNSSFDSVDPVLTENQLDSSTHRLLPFRLDYVLHESFTESKLGYASFTSHTSYWRNQDLALFITKQLNE